MVWRGGWKGKNMERGWIHLSWKKKVLWSLGIFFFKFLPYPYFLVHKIKMYSETDGWKHTFCFCHCLTLLPLNRFKMCQHYVGLPWLRFKGIYLLLSPSLFHFFTLLFLPGMFPFILLVEPKNNFSLFQVSGRTINVSWSAQNLCWRELDLKFVWYARV